MGTGLELGLLLVVSDCHKISNVALYATVFIFLTLMSMLKIHLRINVK